MDIQILQLGVGTILGLTGMIITTRKQEVAGWAMWTAGIIIIVMAWR